MDLLRAEQVAAAPDRALASRGSPWLWGALGDSGPLGKVTELKNLWLEGKC